VFLHLLRPDGQILTQRDSYPGLGSYPTTEWREGEIIADTYLVHLPPESPPEPMEVDVMAGFYLLSTMERLPIVNNVFHHHNAYHVGSIKLDPL
jgi:hypothetical protein